jgi:hypothetical protein
MAEVDSWVHNDLDLGVNLNPRAGPTPLHGGVANTRVSILDPVLAAFMILSFHCTCGLVHGLGVALASHEMPTCLRWW